MLRKSLSVVVLASVGLASAVMAEDARPSTYVEGAIAWPQLDSSGYSATPTAGVVRFGYSFNANWSLEAIGAFSLSDATLDFQGIPIKLSIDSAYGAYIKGQMPVAPHFELFARAGWLHASLKAAVAGASASSSDSSFSWGGGFQIPFGKGWYAQGDYMSYYSKDGDSVRGPAVGVGYRF